MQPKKKDYTTLIIILSIAVLFICGYSWKVAQYHFIDPNATTIQGIIFAFKAFETKVEIPFTWENIVAFAKYFFSSFLLLGFVSILIGYYYYSDKKAHPTDMLGKEHGTAKWNDNFPRFKKKYMDADENGELSSNQMVLSKILRLSLNAKRIRRNLIKVIIGGAGSGKSRFYVKPNILQFNDSSMLINDPSGELLEAEGKALMYMGYTIKIFNLVKMNLSNHYNPFDYIRNDDTDSKENGVIIMVKCILANTVDPNAPKGDPFWDQSIQALFQALCYLLIDFYPKEEQNFAKVYELVLAGKEEKGADDSQSELDKIFKLKEAYAKTKRIKSKAFKNYKNFKLAGEKTTANILVSAAVRIQLFDNTSVKRMTSTDTKNYDNNLNMHEIGDKKMAIFVILPVANRSFTFLSSLMYSQLIETLYYRAENICPKKYHIKANGEILVSMLETKKKAKYELERYQNAHIENEENIEPEIDENGVIHCHPCNLLSKDGEILHTFTSYHSAQMFMEKIETAQIVRGKKELAHHVQMILDEFRNTGTIPDFSQIVATMRKYKMSADIILQNQTQLEELYEKEWKGIIGNCDSFIFLGSSETETCKYISEMLGDTTIKTRSVSQSKGKSGSYSVSWSSTARKLMTPDEVATMDNDYCIIRVRGEHPFLTEKFVLEEHPNYKYSGDANDDNKVLPDDDEFYGRILKSNYGNADEQKAIRFKQNIADMFAHNHDENGKPLIGKAMPMDTEGQIKDALGIKTVDDINETIEVVEIPPTPKDPDKKDLIPDETLLWGF